MLFNDGVKMWNQNFESGTKFRNFNIFENLMWDINFFSLKLKIIGPMNQIVLYEMFCGFKIYFQNYFGAIRKIFIAQNVKKKFLCHDLRWPNKFMFSTFNVVRVGIFFNSDYFTLKYVKKLEKWCEHQNFYVITCY